MKKFNTIAIFVFLFLVLLVDFIWVEIKGMKIVKKINKLSIPNLLGILFLPIIITIGSVIAWAHDYHFETKEIIVSIVMAIISIVIIISLLARDKYDWQKDWFFKTDH